jgi:single-strand DNA-binding protein
MIKLQAIGHLGKDATINTVNGKQVINFNVAHSNTYTNAAGQKITNTTWVNCSWWTESVKVAQYLKKGQQVFVEGAPSVDTYTNQDRQAVAQLRLRVEALQLVGSSKEQQHTAPAQSQYNGPSASDITEPIDDLPF